MLLIKKIAMLAFIITFLYVAIYTAYGWALMIKDAIAIIAPKSRIQRLLNR